MSEPEPTPLPTYHRSTALSRPDESAADVLARTRAARWSEQFGVPVAVVRNEVDGSLGYVVDRALPEEQRRVIEEELMGEVGL